MAMIRRPKPLFFAEQSVVRAARAFVMLDRGSQTHMNIVLDHARGKLYEAVDKLAKIKKDKKLV